jgi:hypothetical protein
VLSGTGVSDHGLAAAVLVALIVAFGMIVVLIV